MFIVSNLIAIINVYLNAENISPCSTCLSQVSRMRTTEISFILFYFLLLLHFRLGMSELDEIIYLFIMGICIVLFQVQPLYSVSRTFHLFE